MDTTTATIRVAVAGCGAIAGKIHLPILRRMAGVRVVAVADPDGAALSRAARIAPGAETLRDWRALIDSNDSDALIIALPTALHAEAAETALKAGLHVYVEKPLATTLEEAQRVRAAAAGAADRIVMLGFNYRFNPLYLSLRAELDAGRIGDLLAVRSVFSTNLAGAGWRGDPDRGGGVLLDLAPHHVDLVRFLTRGEVSRVSATLKTVRSAADTAALQLEMDGGPVAHCFFSLAGAEVDAIDALGTAGSARVNRYESLAVQLRGPTAAGATAGQLRDFGRSVRNLPHLRHKRRAPGNEPSWTIALDRFMQAIRRSTTDYPGLGDGLQTQAVIDAAARSAASGRTEAVQAVSDPTSTTGQAMPEE